jgi:hypothetical protein
MHTLPGFPLRLLLEIPMRAIRTLLALCCLLAIAASAPVSAHGPRHRPGPKPATVYPTDRCVAEKLWAASLYCAATVRVQAEAPKPKPWFFWAWSKARGKKHDAPDHGRLSGPRKALERAWDRAEDAALSDGVSCAETTVGADEMIALLDDGAEALADELDGSRTCQPRRVAAAANTCRTLLGAEARHLLERSRDRDRSRLERTQDRALDRFEKGWKHGCRDRSPAPTAAVADLAEQAFLASVVSPAVSDEWTMITPPDQVPYGDKILEPICSRGTPWVYFAKRGTVNKLIVYYQGGGACWDLLTCGQVAATFKQTAGPGDNPANATSGFANYTNPENPFRDWNAVFVPYCTGDVHWGDAVVQHVPDTDLTTIHHKGRVNAAVAEKYAREHFVHPDQVFVTGSSAGSYGAVVNGLFLQEDAYPSTPFAILGDGGNGVITQDFLENDLAKWGIENNLPRWIPGLDKPLTELSASDLWTEAALYYPQSRFANYSTAYDGGQGGQVGFYNIMLSGQNFLDWFLWWRPSCEWNEQMRMLVQDSATRAPDNYRYYIGVGSRHTMWGHNKVYTDTTGGVPTVVSWLNAMLDGTSDWTDVECTDCGQLLPGDPRPNPPQPPYVTDPVTGETRIDCE